MSEKKILRDITAQTQEIQSDGSEEDTEHLPEDDMDTEFEEIVSDTTAGWLAIHGAKLFALECSKFLAKEAKAKDIRKRR